MPDRAIIFDFDGVIVDSEATWFQAWHEAFASHGHELRPETYTACIGTIGLEPVDELRALTGLDLSRELLAIDKRAWELTLELPMLPGVAGLLEEIDEARLPRAIASSSDRQWVEDLLEHLGIAKGWAVDRAIERLRVLGVRHAIVDAGATIGGQASTIVDVTGPEPVLVRSGAISWDDVCRCLTAV